MSKNVTLTDFDGTQILPTTTSENVFVGAGVTLKEHLQNLADNVPGGTVIVDTELSEESENPVQNKVINTELKNINQKLYIGIGSYDESSNSINLSISNFSSYKTGTIFIGVFSNAITLSNNADFTVNNNNIGEPGSLTPRLIESNTPVIFIVTVVSGIPRVVFADQTVLNTISNLEASIDNKLSTANTNITRALELANDIKNRINRRVYYGTAEYDEDSKIINLTIPDYTEYDTDTLFFGEFAEDIVLTNYAMFTVNNHSIGQPGSIQPREISAGVVAFVVKTVSGVPRVVWCDDLTRLEYFDQKLFKHDNKCEEISNRINTLLNPNIVKESIENVCPFSLNYGLASLKDSGYTLQNGTPTPSEPVDIVGAGIDNLLNPVLETTTKNGVTVTDNGNGTFTLNGIATATTSFCISKTDTEYVDITKTKQLKLVGGTAKAIFRMGRWNSAWGSLSNVDDIGVGVISNPNSNSKLAYVRMYFIVEKDTILTNEIVKPMITTNLNATADMFVPFTDGAFVLPITMSNDDNSKSVRANIPLDAPLYEGDYIEIFEDGSGEIVRTMTIGVFDGSDDENWQYESSYNRFKVYYNANAVCNTEASIAYCNCALLGKPKETISSTARDNIFAMSDKTVYLRTTLFNNVSDFKNSLKDKPLIILYPSDNPTRTPILPAHMAEFLKLTTFEGTTHVNADGSVSIRYYADKVGMLEKELEELKTTLASLVTTNTEE